VSNLLYQIEIPILYFFSFFFRACMFRSRFGALQLAIFGSAISVIGMKI
jgi:hypothetical protein